MHILTWITLKRTLKLTTWKWIDLYFDILYGHILKTTKCDLRDWGAMAPLTSNSVHSRDA